MSKVLTLIDMGRAKCGTDAELARQVGVPRGHVAEWRSGVRPISGESVAAICDVLQITGEEAREWVALAMVENPKNSSRAEMLRRALFACWALGVAALTPPNDAQARTEESRSTATTEGWALTRNALTLYTSSRIWLRRLTQPLRCALRAQYGFRMGRAAPTA